MAIEWIDVTINGSDYEYQISAFSEHERHRPRARIRYSAFNEDGYGVQEVEEEWREGPPPTLNK